MFIDQARIYVKAGDGGNGCTSFVCDKMIVKGKANGGDGGDGGSIILVASSDVNTLLNFHYNRHFKAEKGTNGSSNNKTGKNGKDTIVNVPCGTIIKEHETGLFLRDLVNIGDTIVIAQGGKGGLGNNKRHEATAGTQGAGREVTFELKLIADIGIIGYPNAGKSTFISKISSAKSKAANYPFTTKVPILGVVKYYDDVMIFADMPGLIEGAHSGRGLGDRFLKHIERTKILLHMVDVSLSVREDPYADILTIEKELKLYSDTVSNKRRILAFNKIDILENRNIIGDIEKKVGVKVYPISSATGEGIEDLLHAIFKMLQDENQGEK